MRAACAAVHGGGFAAQTDRCVERSRMKPLTRRAFVGRFCGGLAGVGTMLPLGTARAAYPDRPVRIVVPFLPGGAADPIPRLLSPHLQHGLPHACPFANRARAAGL